MTTYRAYRVDARGHIRTAEWIEAPDDAAAKRKALSMCETGTPAVELWQAKRLVEKISCGEAAA